MLAHLHTTLQQTQCKHCKRIHASQNNHKTQVIVWIPRHLMPTHKSPLISALLRHCNCPSHYNNAHSANIPARTEVHARPTLDANVLANEPYRHASLQLKSHTTAQRSCHKCRHTNAIIHISHDHLYITRIFHCAPDHCWYSPARSLHATLSTVSNSCYLPPWSSLTYLD